MSDGTEESGEQKDMPTALQWTSRPRRSPPAESGFDRWLNGSLQASYGEVTQEPVPSELVELVHRNTRAK
jgi:hypothetical protein